MRIILIFISIILFASCERIHEWETAGLSSPGIVIEAQITDEWKHHEIFISSTIDQLNELPNPISINQLKIRTEDSVWLFVPTTQAGHYISSRPFRAYANETFQLIVGTDTAIYDASTNMTPLNSFQSLVYKQNSYDSLFRITYVAPGFDMNEAAYYEIYLDWSFLPEYSNSDPDSCKALLKYYTLRDIDVNQLFAPTFESISFPKGTIIIEKKYSMNWDYERFMRSILLETVWSGGLFDMQASNVRGNISNNAFGFFSCCSVYTDTVVVE